MSYSGYLHADYAKALQHVGIPRELLHAGGWILERGIHGSDERDAVACYPLLLCRRWDALRDDMEILCRHLVTICGVTDPFGDYQVDTLRAAFLDVVQPFKDHFIVDLTKYSYKLLPLNHQRNIRKSLRLLTVERCVNDEACAADWVRLYGILRARHQIAGPAAFPAASLVSQLAVPGLVAFRAVHQGQTVGMALWYVQGAVGYYHLAAYDDLGYGLGASFAIFHQAFESLAGDGVRWLGLGAGAGTHSAADDGLTRFKRGWATGIKPVYFCGRIFDKPRYAALVTARGSSGSFFPLYRSRECENA